MKSATVGNDISKAEVLNVSPHGFWLFAAAGNIFSVSTRFRGFGRRRWSNCSNVEFSHGHHLHWPELDVDLDLERIEHPEKIPLVARG